VNGQLSALQDRARFELYRHDGLSQGFKNLWRRLPRAVQFEWRHFLKDVHGALCVSDGEFKKKAYFTLTH
jgi:hypothetical protein